MNLSNRKTKKIFSLSATVSITMLSAFVFFIHSDDVLAITATSSEYTLLTTIPMVGNVGDVVNPISVMKNIYGISIGVAAILAVVMIIYAGVKYSTEEAITGKSDAKDKIEGAVYGMVLLLASFIILRTINIDLVNINLDLGKPVAGKLASSTKDIFSSMVNTSTKKIAGLTNQIKTNDDEMKDIAALIATSSDPATKAALENRLTELQLGQTKLEAEKAKEQAITQSNFVVKAFLENTPPRDIQPMIERANIYFKQANAKLEALNGSNPSPETLAEIGEIETQMTIFKAAEVQLNLTNKIEVSTVDASVSSAVSPDKIISSYQEESESLQSIAQARGMTDEQLTSALGTAKQIATEAIKRSCKNIYTRDCVSTYTKKL